MRWTSKLLIHAVLLFGALVFIVPMLWMLVTALKPIDQAMTSPPSWTPHRWVLTEGGETLTVGLDKMPNDTTPDSLVSVGCAYRWLIEIQGEPVPVRFTDGDGPGEAATLNIAVDYHIQAQIDGDWLPAKVQDPLAALAAQDPVSVVVIDADGYTYRKTVKPDQLRRTFDQSKQDLRASFGQSQAMAVPAGSLARSPIDWDDRLELAHVQVEQRQVRAGALSKHIALRWDNFPKAVSAMERFPDYLRNTLVLCVLTVIGTVISSTLVAYGFSRIDWPGRDKMFLVVLATMMIPFPVVMVPLFSMFKEFGWIGTLKPLWVPTFFAGAFNVFLLRQFFRTIPKDLSESARIDGCSEIRIFWQIILPLAKPAITVVALFQFMGTWNDFLGPLIYLTDQKDFTLALGLQFFQSQHGGTQWHYLMAASALVVLPIIVLFFFAQRTFIEGISMTGLKA